jgi:hypothetical protein
VCVTINCHNCADKLDGEKGEFIGKLTGHQGGGFMQVATADGQLLADGSVGNVNADVRGILTTGLKKWSALPESARKPGAVKLKPPMSPPPEEVIAAPVGGLILRVFQRDLKRDDKGEIARITKQDVLNRELFPDENWRWADAHMTQPMSDVMWLTEAEWKALIPARPQVGDVFDVPAGLRMRLFRFHLINGTFGLPEHWSLSQVVRGELTLSVEEVSPILRLRLRGSALMATEANLAKAQRGYDSKLTGILEYDPAKKAFTRFDFVAVGDWWGGDTEGNRFVRPGRTPLGIAFELAKGDRASDFVTPKGQPFKNIANFYFAADKEE